MDSRQCWWCETPAKPPGLLALYRVTVNGREDWRWLSAGCAKDVNKHEGYSAELIQPQGMVDYLRLHADSNCGKGK